MLFLSYQATPHHGVEGAPLNSTWVVIFIPQFHRQSLYWSYLPEFRKRNAEFKQKQKVQFDRQHRVSKQDSIPDGSDVWITSESDTISGTVVSAGENPRSYIVETLIGQVQRNRSHLHVVPESSAEEQSSTSASTPQVIMTRSKTGATLNPPDGLA